MGKLLNVVVVVLLVCRPVSGAVAQSFSTEEKLLFTPPKMYAALYTTEKILVDGWPGEQSWQRAAWSDAFVDIEGDGKSRPALLTNIKMLWNDSCLYIAAQLQEPHLWATLQQHDAVIFHDNDFEVFIDPFNTTQPYFEIEVNAFNTIFDLLLPKPYRNGGNAMIGYDVPGLQHAVHMQGTLNQATDTDTGWTVEMAVPFSALTLGNDVHVPKQGEQWRINFSRVEWDMNVANGTYVKQKGKPEHNWVWSPQGVVNMHYPERWGYVQFNKGDTTVSRPQDETERNLLWLVYYRQKAWQQKHKAYATALSQLQIPTGNLVLSATPKQFLCSIVCVSGRQLSIDQDGHLITEAQ